MPYFDAKDFPHNMAAIWERHFGYLQSTGATVVVGEWGGFGRGKDRIWQDAFAAFLLDKGLSSFYWSLNPNSQDTGGLLTSSWSQPESAKLGVLRMLPSTALLPILAGRPHFQCSSSGSAQHHHHRCSGSDNLCILTEQVCNGAQECPGGSDEQTCSGIGRPCMAMRTSGAARPCIFPFLYNGYSYRACTLVDALDSWQLVGTGRCASGYIAALSVHGISLSTCQTACAGSQQCAFISYSSTDGGFCSGYGDSCAQEPLAQGRTDYLTYRFNSMGGAWCATAVTQNGEYRGMEWAGTCEPGCGKPLPAGELLRSRCSNSGVHSDVGPAHCNPSPPPPPVPLPPPSPGPHMPPARPPPTNPPPWLAFWGLNDILQEHHHAAAMDLAALLAMLAILLCTCYACICLCSSAYKVDPGGRQAFRHMSVDELEALEPNTHRFATRKHRATTDERRKRARRSR